MAPDDLVLFRNVGLDDTATGLQTLSVGEPSVANNGDQILMTGNWYGSRSLDDAATWPFVSPFETLPPRRPRSSLPPRAPTGRNATSGATT